MNTSRSITFPSHKNTDEAFTLVEVLVVIVIIAVLTALLFPALFSATTRSQQTKSSSNLRSIGVAMLSFANDNNGHPPAARGTLKYNGDAFNVWWAVHLMPYVGNNAEVFSHPKTEKEILDPAAYDPRSNTQLYIGYWINAGVDGLISFPHGPVPFWLTAIAQGRNPHRLSYFQNPMNTVGLIEGIGGEPSNGWNPGSNDEWRSGLNDKYYQWGNNKFNVLWMDGHVSLESPESLEESDFLIRK